MRQWKTIGHRSISFGKIDYYGNGRRINEVEIELTLRESEDERRDVEFSACGGVWNSRMTDYQMCGQCLDIVSSRVCENRKLWTELKEIWKKWHLNDCKAGTPEQYDLLSEHFREQGGRTKWEDEVAYLKSVGKYEVEWKGKTVRWGERYVYWEIPGEILERFREIIRTGK